MKKRLQFDFTKESVANLDALKVLTKSATRVEVVRRALRLYKYSVQMALDGYQINLSKGKDRFSLSPLLLM